MSDNVKRVWWIGFGFWRLTLPWRWERTDLLLVGFGTDEEGA